MSILGTYRNGAGVELEVTGLYNQNRDVIGVIYEGVIRDQLFGPRYALVTDQGLAECGYVKIDATEPTK